jgi:hypothetical protein
MPREGLEGGDRLPGQAGAARVCPPVARTSDLIPGRLTALTSHAPARDVPWVWWLHGQREAAR